MAWTAPRTWTDGETVTAAMLNAHVRDNLNALGSVPVTSLPGGPTDGDICVLTDSLTVPTLQWPLRYNATATKWQAYGGGWGYGTSLPTPTGLDRVPFTLVDSATNPTYQWDLRYHAGSANTDKWECVGGNPLLASGTMANTTNAYTTIATITIPRSGVYTVRAFVWGVNTAAGCDPQYRINGSAQLTVTTGPTGKALVLEKEHTLTSTQAVDVQARANGSDTTTAHGSISITPIRLS